MRLLDMSQYVTHTQDIDLTVPPNSTYQCDWTAQHGWLTIGIHFSYVEFKHVFVPKYSKDNATFVRDYLYDIQLECYQIQTPENYTNLDTGNYSFYLSDEYWKITTTSQPQEDDATVINVCQCASIIFAMFASYYCQ